MKIYRELCRENFYIFQQEIFEYIYKYTDTQIDKYTYIFMYLIGLRQAFFIYIKICISVKLYILYIHLYYGYTIRN